MRWLAKRVRADDGPENPQVGIPAHDVLLQRLPPSSDFRIALTDEQGAVISSIDLSRGDLHDVKRAIVQVMAVVKPNGG